MEFIFSENTTIHKVHTIGSKPMDNITITTKQLGMKTLNRLEIKRLEEKINGEKNIMKKGEEDMSEKLTFAFVRFADSKDNFNSKSKLYAYELYNDLAIKLKVGDCLRVNSLRNVSGGLSVVRQAPIKENYNGTVLRIEAIERFSLEEIPINSWRAFEDVEAVGILSLISVNSIIKDWDIRVYWTQSHIGIEYIYNKTIVPITFADFNDVLKWAIEKEENEFNLKGHVSVNQEEKTKIYQQIALNGKTYLCPTDKPIKLYYEGPSSINDTTGAFGYYTINEEKTTKEEKTMSKIFDNIFKNVKFGTLDTDELKYSMQGIAFKDKDGSYFTYHSDGTSLDVTGMTIDIPLFIMPVALADIKSGDIIEHKGDFVIVLGGDEHGIKVINPCFGEVVTRIPEINIFGFNYASKVVNYFEGIKPDNNNPFGNLLPLMLLNDKNNDDTTNLLMMSMMSGNMDFTNNPMLMYMMMGDKGSNNDFFQTMMMMQLFNPSMNPLGNQNFSTTAPANTTEN